MAERSSRLIDFQLSSHGRSTPHPQCIPGGGSFLIGPSATLTQMWTRIYVLSQILAEIDASSRVGSLFTVGVLTVWWQAVLVSCRGVWRYEAFCFYFIFIFIFILRLLLSDTIAFASFRRIHYSCLFWSFPILAHYIEAIPRLNPNCKPWLKELKALTWINVRNSRIRRQHIHDHVIEGFSEDRGVDILVLWIMVLIYVPIYKDFRVEAHNRMRRPNDVTLKV